jgi:hypothetical protein
VITLDVRRWNVRHLIGVSAAYWTALAAATLAPFARVVAPLVLRSGQHGSVSASLGDGGINLTALKDGAAVYTASASFPLIAFWVAGPPLALWLMWLALRPSRDAATELHPSPAHEALPDAAPGAWSDRDAAAPRGVPVERRENRG